MSRPSALYRRLGIAGGRLLDVTAGAHALGDQVSSITMTRGGAGLSEHTAGTVTLDTPHQVTPSGGAGLTVHLAPEAGDLLAAAGYTTRTSIEKRFTGRVATQEALDKGDGRGRWRGTAVAGAAWSSLLENAPNTWTPTAGASLSTAALALFRPPWESRVQAAYQGTPDTWYAAGDPITARDLLGILTERLHYLGDLRNGTLLVRTLGELEQRAGIAATATWPLARAHCVAPTRWVQPSPAPREYRVQVRTTTGIAEIITGETPTGTTRIEDLDWTTFVDRSEQWRRVYGLRWDSFQEAWRLPSVTVRLDHLLTSPYEGHRRAAGTLLRLDVGEPLPLADDWPTQLRGVHIITGMTETLTPQAWTLTLSLASYRSLAGALQLAVKPRTWDQAGTRTWDQATTTWTQGVNA